MTIEMIGKRPIENISKIPLTSSPNLNNINPILPPSNPNSPNFKSQKNTHFAPTAHLLITNIPEITTKEILGSTILSIMETFK
jgi:hypothetical protein